MENISLEPTCTSNWFWYFLDFFSVSNKICWMLSTESRIINSVKPDKRRRLSPAERGWPFENTISLELHCKGKTFAEKSRYICFILLLCPASTNTCVTIRSNVSLAFCDGVLLYRVFANLIILIFHQENFT